MMTSEEKSELLRMMRKEIALAMNIVLNGVAVDSATDTEGIGKMFPGMDTQVTRPKVEPYGFHSLAPDNTLSVCAQVGDHFGSRYVIGHRDSKRPTDTEKGEAGVYNVAGYEVRCALDRIQVRKGSTIYTAVLGEPLTTLLSAMLSDIASHTHSFTPTGVTPGVGSGTPGTTGAPGNAAAFTTLKGQVDAGTLLAKDEGGFP